MKVRLYRKLLRRGRAKITILSVIDGSHSCGMSYSHPGGEYRGLYSFGDSEEDVKNKAARVYIREYLVRKGRE